MTGTLNTGSEHREQQVQGTLFTIKVQRQTHRIYTLREMAGESSRESDGPGPEYGRRPGFWELQKMPSQKTCLGKAEEHKIGTEQDYELKVGACLLSISLAYLRAKYIVYVVQRNPVTLK